MAGELAGMGLDFTDYDLGGYSGDPNMGTAVGVPVPVYSGYPMPGDISDEAQMAPWTPPYVRQQAGGDVPWWASAAVYGISKAIDNAFPNSPSGVMGNVYPGSGASVSGRTYSQRPVGAGGGTMGAGYRRPLARGGPGLFDSPAGLLLIGAVLLLVLHH